jgi:hypothetical protein
MTRSGDPALALNRLSSDGAILGLYKDGTTVGSWRSRSGDRSTIILDPRSGGGGLSGGGAGLYPTDNAGTISDGALTLGDPAARFKDLYLSGGIQFDSRSNKLDDYEEGIFSLVAQGSGYTLGTNSGFYTKVGRQVTLQYMFGFTAVGGNNSSCTFTGIPFASANLLAGTCQSGALRENTNTGAIYVANVQNNNTQFEINSMDGVGSAKQRTLRANETYCATVTYFTT